MNHASSSTKFTAKVTVALCTVGLALTGCSGDSGSHDAASSHATKSSSSSSSAGTTAQDPATVTRLGDALRITDNGISPEQLQKDVTTPITKAAADTYAATVKSDEAWAKQLAGEYGGGATAVPHLDRGLKADIEEAQAAATQKVFPARCTDMPHLTNLVSHPTGSTFGVVLTGDKKVVLYYAKLGKGTMPLDDVFRDYLTCTNARVVTKDGISGQMGYQTLPLKSDDGLTGYTIRQFEKDDRSYYIDVTEHNGVRLTAVSYDKEASRKDVEDAFGHGADLLPTTPAPGIMAAPHKEPVDFTDVDLLENHSPLITGPGLPLTFQPHYSETWTKSLLSAMGQPTPRALSDFELKMGPFLYPYITEEYNRQADKQECLPSSNLGYVSFGGGLSSQRPLDQKAAWFLTDDGSTMASLVALTPGPNNSVADSPLPLEDVFKNSGRCTSVTFKDQDPKGFTVDYTFDSFTTSSGQKAYIRTFTKNEDIMHYKYVAMTDVDKVRVTVWSQSDKDLKTDLEKAMKAAKQQPTS